MCAQFLIKASVKDLTRKLGVVYRDEETVWEELVVPQRLAPVIVADDFASRHLTPMRFGLIPSWSKEPKVKFATHNARLQTEDENGVSKFIYEKPTWRGPFAKHHCLIPINGFIEPIYSGEMAGHMVNFHREDSELLLAAGIWDIWVSPKTGEVIESFAIVTDDPLKFVEATGHDRSPLFLAESGWEGWLSPAEKNPAKLVDWLKKHKQSQVELVAEKFRPMKKGWEKRA